MLPPPLLYQKTTKGGGDSDEMSEFFFGPRYVAAEVSDPPEQGAIAALLIISHWPMLMAVSYALLARHARLFVAGLGSFIIFSLLYHAQRAGLYYLGVPTNVWRLLDHMAVLWLIGEIAMHLMITMWAPQRSQFFFLVAGYLVFPIGAVSVLTLPYSFLSTLIMAIFLVIVAAVRLSLLFYEGDLCGLAPDDDGSSSEPVSTLEQRNNWTTVWLVVGIIASALGLVCYFVPESTPAGNSISEALFHSAWHILSGVALGAFSAATSARTLETLKRHARKLDMQRVLVL